MASNFLGSSQGVSIVDDAGTTFITSEYNSGVMTSDIKGAFLSDTDATNVTGTELWPEGDFADANEWSSAGAEWTISGGTATVSDGDGGYSFLGQSTGTLTNGKKYVLSFTVSNYSGGRLEASQANSNNIQIPFSANGSYSQLINYTGTSGSGLGMYGYGGGAVGFTLDNLYLRELEEEDRSVNNTGLQVFGTVTKSAVATGAELVAYSGWNNSNYFEQPYNSDMQFGSTNDFSISFWMKQTSPAVSGFGGVIDNGYASSSAKYFLVGTDSNGKAFFRVSGGNGLENNLTGLITVTGGQWHHIVCVRESSGTITRIYVDGLLDNSLTGTARDVSNTDNHQLTVGDRSNSTDRYFTGSLALLRVSASAPSAEQIKKIYEDEKVLFQENAACTLYGTSDAVTALAYDDTTDLLHVGTSSGRSEFKGLRRVGNTTTAVTTAISASSGLVAEQ